MNTGSAIFVPFFGMLLLTLVVWFFMYARRLHYVFGHRVAAQRLQTPEQLVAIIPEAVQRPANNLRNLFELPVVFYALCLYLYVTGNVDSVYVSCAWAFLGFRCAHSLVHCTVNVVIWRFGLYVLGSLVLWFMLLRAGFQLLAGM